MVGSQGGKHCRVENQRECLSVAEVVGQNALDARVRGESKSSLEADLRGSTGQLVVCIESKIGGNDLTDE